MHCGDRVSDDRDRGMWKNATKDRRVAGIESNRQTTHLMNHLKDLVQPFHVRPRVRRIAEGERGVWTITRPDMLIDLLSDQLRCG